VSRHTRLIAGYFVIAALTTIFWTMQRVPQQPCVLSDDSSGFSPERQDLCGTTREHHIQLIPAKSAQVCKRGGT
jgi:hypothetical protein